MSRPRMEPEGLGLVITMRSSPPASAIVLAASSSMRMALTEKNVLHVAASTMTTGFRAAASCRIPGSGSSFAMSTPSGVVTTGVPFRVQVQKCSIVPACLPVSFW